MALKTRGLERGLRPALVEGRSHIAVLWTTISPACLQSIIPLLDLAPICLAKWPNKNI